ncbi:MAG: hypothetical protein NTW16_10900 [Bacteroidetes bacterium]|nr:hypothetical protein [Bacteroidota bacterium]
MEQEDYIKRQIDQLGRVLGKIFADLTGLRTQGQTGEVLEAADHSLKSELGLNIDELTSISTENFIPTLQTGRNFNHDSLDTLADILFLLAEEPDHDGSGKEHRRKLYDRSLVIYEYLDAVSGTYSFDRHLRMEKIKSMR